jgi:diguanylate cyclase (GGDEF)-like protein/PAS domain S-box-containing protein
MYWSPEIRAIFGLPLDEPISTNTLNEFLHPDDRERVIAMIRNAQSPAGEGCFNVSHRIVRRDGEIRWLEVQFKTTFSGEGEARRTARTLGAVRDITRRKQNEEGLQLAASVYQSSREGILVTDENNLIIDVNPAFTQLTGYTLDEARGKNPRLFSSGRHDAEFYREMWQSIGESGHWQGEVWDKRRDGELHVKWLSISVIRHPNGSIFRHVAQFSDITEKKRQDEKIWAQANFDALTGLPNRSLLADRTNQAMSSSARSGMHGAILSLDLDHFKQLNDTFGHSMGDQLLIEVARRLLACVREEDTVARMGGDEFIVVLNELSGEQNEAAVQAEIVAEKIRSEWSPLSPGKDRISHQFQCRDRAVLRTR